MRDFFLWPELSAAALWSSFELIFKVMRRTNASLGHSAKVDPKVAADQRGHGIGVSLDEYTMSNLKDKATAAKKLEDSVLGRKVVRMPKRKAS